MYISITRAYQLECLLQKKKKKSDSRSNVSLDNELRKIVAASA